MYEVAGVDRSTIGARLHTLRRWRGLTQEQLADLAGAPRRTSRCGGTAGGSWTGRSQISALAAALRVSETDLVGGPHLTPDLSPKRQARYLIDLARAHVMRRHTGDALRCLQQAEQLAPEQARSNRAAREAARDLVQLASRRTNQELRELAERFRVLP